MVGIFMKPEDDPWLKDAHANAELLDREIKKLHALTSPIRDNLPIITRYQDFWNQAKLITRLFKEKKPLARNDRDLLWNEFNGLCGAVRESQKAGHGALESLSQGHLDKILHFLELAHLPPGAPAGQVELVKRGQALKGAGDHLGTYKHEMIAKHKKTCFDRIQECRKTHDAAWARIKEEKPSRKGDHEARIRKNIAANYERRKKAANALENFQIGRGHILTFLAGCEDPAKLATAKARLAETEARIGDIENGIRQLDAWIADDEKRLKGK
jgi:hypothetical protein